MKQCTTGETSLAHGRAQNFNVLHFMCETATPIRDYGDSALNVSLGTVIEIVVKCTVIGQSAKITRAAGRPHRSTYRGTPPEPDGSRRLSVERELTAGNRMSDVGSGGSIEEGDSQRH